MSYGDKPFGLRDVKLTNITGTTQEDLPAALQMDFRPRLNSAEFRGDDRVQAVVSVLEALEFGIQAGGISIDALAIMVGQSVVVTGTTPNEVSTLTLSGGDTMPYFKIYGKSVGDGTDDVHVKLFKCKLTQLEGSFQDSQFFITNAQGVAIDDGTNGITDVVQNETAANLPSS